MSEEGMVMWYRWIAASVLVAGLTVAGTSTVRADDCGRGSRVPLPDCAEWEWETIHNVTRNETYYELQVSNSCPETITIKVDVGAGKSDSMADISPYTSWAMERNFEEDEKDLVNNVTCCTNLSRCDF